MEENRRNGDRQSYEGPPTDSPVNDGSLALEFISAAKSVEEAIPKTRFAGDKQLVAIVKLYHLWVKRHNAKGLRAMLLYLNGLPAIGGYNRAQALMADAKVVFPEAMGVKVGKDTLKFMEAQMAARTARQQETKGEVIEH